jgi:hypothetical protein
MDKQTELRGTGHRSADEKQHNSETRKREHEKDLAKKKAKKENPK